MPPCGTCLPVVHALPGTSVLDSSETGPENGVETGLENGVENGPENGVETGLRTVLY